MAFEPNGKDHALIEAVFGILLSEPVTPDQVQALVAGHDRWKDDFPKIQPLGLMPAIFVNQNAQLPANVSITGGVVFDDVKRDGSVAWRIRVEGNAIFINCLDYSRWNDVWPKVLRTFRSLSSVAFSESLVSSSVFQVIDLFKWRSETETYNARKLFRSDNRYLTASVLDAGPMWHNHQGWYRSTAIPPEAAKVLERVHIDAVGTHEAAEVKFDTYIQCDFTDQQAMGVLLDDAGKMKTIFDYLHEGNKRVLRNYITDEMAERIKLNVA